MRRVIPTTVKRVMLYELREGAYLLSIYSINYPDGFLKESTIIGFYTLEFQIEANIYMSNTARVAYGGSSYITFAVATDVIMI